MKKNYPITAAPNESPQLMTLAPSAVEEPLASPGASIDVVAIVAAFRRRWWVVALFALLGVGAMALLLTRITPVYHSHVSVEVGQGKLKVLEFAEINPEDLSKLEVLKTIEQTFASSSLLLRVAEACNLRDDPDFIRDDGRQYGDAELVALLRGMISVGLRRGTRLIDIDVEDTDPQRAKLLAETMVSEFDRWEVEQARSIGEDVHQALGVQTGRLRQQLDEAQAKILAYRETHNTLRLEGREAVLGDEEKALNAELAKTRGERLRLQADLARVGSSGQIATQDALSLPSVAARLELVALRGLVSAKESEFEMIKQRYKHKHPAYTEVSSELVGLKSALAREAQLAALGLENAKRSLEDKEKALEAELDRQRGELLELQRVLVPYKALARELETDRVLYEGVRQRQKEALAASAVERGAITLTEAALAPAYPFWPRKNLLLALGLVAGVALGVGLVLLGEVCDRSFRSEAQAERVLGMPMLASLPKAGRGRTLGFDPGGAAGEAFRRLRTSLSFFGKGAYARTFLFVSARPGEGASECAANCAAAFARQGHRTLVIDANLGDPSLDIVIGDRRVPDGLAQYLSGAGETGQVVNTTPVENLYLLAAGEGSEDASELLANGRLGGLIEESRQWFHRIVINAAPLDGMSDGLVVSRYADSVCLVIEAGVTPRREVLRARQLLSMAGAPSPGFVLNGAASADGEKAERGRVTEGVQRVLLQEA